MASAGGPRGSGGRDAAGSVVERSRGRLGGSALAMVGAWAVPVSALVVPWVVDRSRVVEAGRRRWSGVAGSRRSRRTTWSGWRSGAATTRRPRAGSSARPARRRSGSGRGGPWPSTGRASPYHAEGLADWSSRYRDHVGFDGSTAEFARAYLADRHALEARFGRMTRRRTGRTRPPPGGDSRPGLVEPAAGRSGRAAGTAPGRGAVRGLPGPAIVDRVAKKSSKKIRRRPFSIAIERLKQVREVRSTLDEPRANVPFRPSAQSGRKAWTTHLGGGSLGGVLDKGASTCRHGKSRPSSICDRGSRGVGSLRIDSAGVEAGPGSLTLDSDVRRIGERSASL